jgi:hypothetical protein
MQIEAAVQEEICASCWRAAIDAGTIANKSDRHAWKHGIETGFVPLASSSALG